MLNWAGFLMRRADAARDSRNWMMAQARYQAVLRSDPAHLDALVQYGHALREQQLFTQALAAYREAVRLAPTLADAHHQIARTLDLLGEHDAALAGYDAALTLEPSLADARQEAYALRIMLAARSKLRPAGLPEQLRYLNLGTTGTCNASCIHCPTGKSSTAHAPRHPMAMSLFEKIVDGIIELGLPITGQVAFGLFGDGLVDPLVVDRAEYLRSKMPSVPISVNTNGAAFSAAKHSRLNTLASIIALHCESLVPETYDDLMRPLRAERVFPKFEQMLDTFPGKVVVSVPMSKRNLDELPLIRQWFLERGALRVQFDPLSSRCAEDRSVFDALALNPQPIRCPPDIMDDLIVDCDGQVLICCQDFERIEGIGNLRTESLAEVLAGVHRQRTRTLLAESHHEELATCSRCFADLRGDYIVP